MFVSPTWISTLYQEENVPWVKSTSEWNGKPWTPIFIIFFLIRLLFSKARTCCLCLPHLYRLPCSLAALPTGSSWKQPFEAVTWECPSEQRRRGCEGCPVTCTQTPRSCCRASPWEQEGGLQVNPPAPQWFQWFLRLTCKGLKTPLSPEQNPPISQGKQDTLTTAQNEEIRDQEWMLSF